MTKKTWFGWEVACACLVIGCGGSSNKSRSSYETTPSPAPVPAHAPAQPQTEEPTATTTPSREPGNTPSDSMGGPTAADAQGNAQGSTETKVTAPVTGEPPITGAKNDSDLQKAGAAPVAGTASENKLHAEATITMLGENGAPVGTLNIDQDGNKVVLRGTFTGLKPGKHGIHIHEKGDCGGKDAKNAGAHFNPTKAKHGPPESGNRHAGDFGNLLADKEGNATFEMITDSLTVAPGPDSVAGRAVVIHKTKDDGKTQPSGASGPPIACGVIEVK